MQATDSFLRSYWGSLRFQIAQQSLQDFLIGVVLLPIAEIGNVACAANVSSPTGWTVFDGTIQTNGKQHRCFFAVLFGNGRFDFKFDPRTVDGMLRQHQQQLIMQTDGLVNTISDLVSSFQVFGRKPAAYPFALQVSIQPFDKLLIFTRIADKAGVVLDGSGDERAGIVNKGIRQTGTTQEHFWNVSMRPNKCICPDSRWTSMVDGFESLHCSQINISENGTSYDCFLEDSFSKIGVCEVGIYKLGFGEVGFGEVGFGEVGSAEIGFAKIGSAEIGFDEIGVCELGSAEIGFFEVGKPENGYSAIDSAEIGSGENSVAEIGPKDMGILETGIFEIDMPEMSKAEIGSSEVGIEEISMLENSVGEIGVSEIGFPENSIAEIGVNLWMLLSPLIPALYSLFQASHIFVVCHYIHLLFGALIIARYKHCCKYCSTVHSFLVE